MCIALDKKQRERKNNYWEDLRTKKTILTPILGFIFLYLEFLPFPLILRKAKRSCKCLKEHSVVELYVLTFLAIESVIFWITAKYFPGPVSIIAAIIIAIILGMRLLDIMQSWVNILLVKPEAEILYASRLLILTLINYIELVLTFSVLGYVWNASFVPKFQNLTDSMVFTLGTMTAIGSKYEPVSVGAWVIYVSEIGFGLFFLIIAVVRVLTYFEARKK